MYKIYTFSSTHSALFAEKIINDGNISAKIIPTPRKISASCGFALRISADDFKKTSELILKNKINFDNTYDMDEKGQII